MYQLAKFATLYLGFNYMFSDILPAVIVYVLIISGSIQILYYWLFFARLAFYKNKTTTSDQKPVSIIICARNEYHNLVNTLPMILNQNYPEYEVLVVNDCSDDDTEYLLRKLAEKHPQLSYVNLYNNVNFFSGKKFPLSIGIKSAKYDTLLLTDADCSPSGTLWLQHMQAQFSEKTEIVLGYGAIHAESSFLNKLIRYETIHTAIQYFSYALAGLPYMGVGRNLAYKKELFYKNKGFINHYTQQSGDDDLFVNQNANKQNTAISIDPAAFTYSKGKQTFSQWMFQKKRHLSVGKLYKSKHKFLLGLYSISILFFWLSLVPFFIFHTTIDNTFMIAAAIIFLRLSSWYLMFKLSMNKLNEKDLLLISLLMEIIYLLLLPVFYLSNTFNKQKKWK